MERLPWASLWLTRRVICTGQHRLAEARHIAKVVERSLSFLQTRTVRIGKPSSTIFAKVLIGYRVLTALLRKRVWWLTRQAICTARPSQEGGINAPQAAAVELCLNFRRRYQAACGFSRSFTSFARSQGRRFALTVRYL